VVRAYAFDGQGHVITLDKSGNVSKEDLRDALADRRGEKILDLPADCTLSSTATLYSPLNGIFVCWTPSTVHIHSAKGWVSISDPGLRLDEYNRCLWGARTDAFGLSDSHSCYDTSGNRVPIADRHDYPSGWPGDTVIAADAIEWLRDRRLYCVGGSTARSAMNLHSTMKSSHTFAVHGLTETKQNRRPAIKTYMTAQTAIVAQGKLSNVEP